LANKTRTLFIALQSSTTGEKYAMQTVENQKIIITPSDGVAEMWNKENHKG
jgi:hypothetical protein